MAGGTLVRLGQEPGDAEHGDDRDDDVVRDAPLADRVDACELRPQQVAAEGGARPARAPPGERRADAAARASSRGSRRTRRGRAAPRAPRRASRSSSAAPSRSRRSCRSARCARSGRRSGTRRSRSPTDAATAIAAPKAHCSAAASAGSNVAGSSAVDVQLLRQRRRPLQDEGRRAMNAIDAVPDAPRSRSCAVTRRSALPPGSPRRSRRRRAPRR